MNGLIRHLIMLNANILTIYSCSEPPLDELGEEDLKVCKARAKQSEHSRDGRCVQPS